MEKGNKFWSLTIFYIAVISLMLGGVFLGNKTVSAIAQSAPISQYPCIIIDPGHGGEDGGTVSPDGKFESEYNLEISLRVEALLHLLGYPTKMTRREDISIYTKGDTISQKKISDLKERVRIVNHQKNPVLISIHQNFFGDSRYSGAQVFHANTEESKRLAKVLQTALKNNLNPGSKRDIKKGSGIYLLEQVQCPAVLIECGFLSNPQESALLKEPAYQKKISTVIVTTLCEYLCNYHGAMV